MTAKIFSRRALLLALALPGCASPDPALYTLAAVPGVPRGGAPRLIELRRIGLPGYLDRPGLIATAGEDRLHLMANARWAEPLGDMLGRVLQEDLSQRLPGSLVFRESGAITAAPDAVVEVDVARLDRDAAGAMVLQATIAVRRPGAAPRTARGDWRGPPQGAAAQAVIAAMDAALAALADRIAAELTAPSPG